MPNLVWPLPIKWLQSRYAQVLFKQQKHWQGMFGSNKDLLLLKKAPPFQNI